jgi:hypothetical protein
MADTTHRSATNRLTTFTSGCVQLFGSSTTTPFTAVVTCHDTNGQHETGTISGSVDKQGDFYKITSTHP